MADDEQFSLCWNNFNSNLSAGFHESLQRGDLVDVTLAAEGQLVQAHRLVLSVCSPYFRKMFNQMPKNQHAFVFLKDVTHSALQDLIQFMYCGEVNVKQDALPAFISTAEALQIKGLTETGDSAPSQQSPVKDEAPAVPVATASISTTVPAASQRTKVQRNRIQSYKLESEESGDDKIVHLQASTTHHVTAQQLQAQTSSSSQKRVMPQRGIQSHASKRTKMSISASSDGLDTSDTATTPTQTQTVQTVQIVKQIPAQVIEPEYIELPIESINPKAEPDYTDETAEIETVDAETEQEHKLSEHDQGDADDDGNYVEDETYGDMGMSKYEESYLTEGEESAKPGVSGFVDSYTSDGGTGTEQSTQAATIMENNNSIISLPPLCPIENSAPDSAVELKFIKSPWSTPCLVLNNYLYNSHSTRGDIGYWRCHNYSRKIKEERCRARCVIKNGRLSALTGAQHNHPPHTEKIERIVRRNLADELQQEQEMPRTQQQQSHREAMQCYQPEREKKAAQHTQHSEDILLLMAPTCPATNHPQAGTADASQEGEEAMMRAIGQQNAAVLDVVTGAPLMSSVTTVVPPAAIAELIKMEDYELSAVEM